MIPSGIETATFRFVAQHLNHCATAVPHFTALLLGFHDKCRLTHLAISLLYPTTLTVIWMITLYYFRLYSLFQRSANVWRIIQYVPIATEPGISLIILTSIKILQWNLNSSTSVVRKMKRNVSVVCVSVVCVSVLCVCLWCVSVVCVCSVCL